MLSDSLNTTVTVVATLQNSVVSYSALTLNYLFIVGIAAQLAGIFGFWTVQKRFGLSTKTMFDAVMLGIVLLDGWGMIGIWTQKFGFHHEWEFWVYQVWYGLFVCPWYSYSQIMISEVTPRGKEFLFFALFSIMGKTSAFIGPIVSPSNYGVKYACGTFFEPPTLMHVTRGISSKIPLRLRCAPELAKLVLRA